MKAIEHLAQVLENLELEIPCDYLTDLDDVCCKTCNSHTGARKECWLRYAEAMEKQDGETPDCIPCGYIRAKAYKATGAESTYLRKLLDDWEKENEN